MIPQKVIITQQQRVLNLLRSPNPDGYTRMQIADGMEKALEIIPKKGLK